MLSLVAVGGAQMLNVCFVVFVRGQVGTWTAERLIEGIQAQSPVNAGVSGRAMRVALSIIASIENIIKSFGFIPITGNCTHTRRSSPHPEINHALHP